jgi:hypothetical protein
MAAPTAGAETSERSASSGRRRAAAVVGALGLVSVLAVVATTWGQPARPLAGVAGVTSPPSAVASVAPEPSLPPVVASASPAPPTPSPSRPARPGSGLTVTATVLHPWVDPFDEVRAQILVEVTNQADAAAYLVPGETAYRVTSPGGETVAGSRFAHVFPPLVPPGGRAWLIDTISATFVDPADLRALDVTVEERPPEDGDEDRAAGLVVQGVEWRASATGGLEASGVVANTGSTTVGRIAIAVILLGQNGQMLAGVYDVDDARDLAPGETASFTTDYPGTAPLDPTIVAGAEAVAVAMPD